MKILIIGNETYLGKKLIESFSTEHEVGSINSLNFPFLPKEDNLFDLFICCSFIEPKNIKDLVGYAKCTGAKKFIYISSGRIYGNKTITPSHVESKPDFETEEDTFKKIIGEFYCEHYAKQYKINYLIMRIFDIYGDDEEESIIAQLKKSNTLDCLPSATRDFINISDVIRVFKHYLDGKGNFHTGCINVATGVETSIIDLAEEMGKEVTFTGKDKIEFSRADITDLNFMGIIPEIKVKEWIKNENV